MGLARNVYTLNTDLSVYWAKQSESNPDGFIDFFSKPEDIASIKTLMLSHDPKGYERRMREDQSIILYLNSNLALIQFKDSSNKIRMAKVKSNWRTGGNSLIDNVCALWKLEHVNPLYIPDGDAENLAEYISNTEYLRFVFEKLNQSEGSFVLFGCKFDECCDHIFNCLLREEMRQLAVGVFPEQASNMIHLLEVKLKKIANNDAYHRNLEEKEKALFQAERLMTGLMLFDENTVFS